MAVDTRAKRLSMLSFSTLDLLNTDPATSGVDAAEREDFINLYRGIALNNPAAPTGDHRPLLLSGVGA